MFCYINSLIYRRYLGLFLSRVSSYLDDDDDGPNENESLKFFLGSFNVLRMKKNR